MVVFEKKYGKWNKTEEEKDFFGKCCNCHELDAVYLNQKAQGFCEFCFNRRYGVTNGKRNNFN